MVGYLGFDAHDDDDAPTQSQVPGPATTFTPMQPKVHAKQHTSWSAELGSPISHGSLKHRAKAASSLFLYPEPHSASVTVEQGALAPRAVATARAAVRRHLRGRGGILAVGGGGRGGAAGSVGRVFALGLEANWAKSSLWNPPPQVLSTFSEGWRSSSVTGKYAKTGVMARNGRSFSPVRCLRRGPSAITTQKHLQNG